MNNRSTSKLNNKQGVSIIITLVVLLVIIMTVALIIVASTANASKAENRLNEQQAIAMTNGVVRSLKTGMNNSEASAKTDESGNVKTPVPSVKKGGVFYADCINTSLSTIAGGGTPEVSTYEVSLTDVPKALNGYTAAIELSMDKDSYGLKGYIVIKKGRYEYRQPIKIPAAKKTVTSDSRTSDTWHEANKDATKVETVYTWSKIETYQK